MSNSSDAVPINSLKGMAVLSLATGNKIGRVEDVFIDPVDGNLSGLSLTAENGLFFVPCGIIHSFGRDAVMARDETSVAALEAFENAGCEAKRILGASVITESGEVLGRISDIYLSLKPPPAAVYQIRNSLLDKLLGRELWIPASAGHALSDDAQRLVIPDLAAEAPAHSLNELLGQGITVRSFPATEPPAAAASDEGDETVVRVADDDETVVRLRDEDETVVRFRDEDDTVVRLPRKAS